MRPRDSKKPNERSDHQKIRTYFPIFVRAAHKGVDPSSYASAIHSFNWDDNRLVVRSFLPRQGISIADANLTDTSVHFVTGYLPIDNPFSTSSVDALEVTRRQPKVR